jgi:DNA repair exonuclease SbcCD ATPase subunit
VKELERLQTWLQKETSSALEGPKLLKKVGEITASLDKEIEKYSDSSEVDTLRASLSDLEDVLNYLRDEEQVLAAEKELPLVEKQIKDIEGRINRLQALASSLQSIRQFAIAYEKEASLAQLKLLEETINGYYSKILGHPHFTHLKIDVEKEDPLIFSIRAASSREDTYIPTRFSTAQLNAVALSIFMSYSTQEAGDLPIMILDDPTQNMDNSHKEAFAKLIATLPPKHQVIIATEDNDTRRWLEKSCKGIKTYELGNWTPEGTEFKEVG